jgi:butyryl-CoA dehydrogenase
MDFELSEEERLIQETAREFARNVVEPAASRTDQEGRFPAEVISQMRELGFLGITVPAEYGGAGMGNVALSLLLIELNRACASTGVIVSVHNSLVCGPLTRFGNDDQKRRYLPRLASGEWLGAYALTEPEAGSDAGNQQTVGVRHGNEWTLTGTKIFITTGKEAGFYIVFARTVPGSHGPDGVSAFLVERTSHGLQITREEEKMGIRGSSTMTMVLDGCRVPHENLLGEEAKGFAIAMDTLNGGRIGIACQAVGIAEGCLEASLKYAKDREQFGKKIAEFQAIQWKLADMATKLEAARLLTLKAAWLRDQGHNPIIECSMAKLFASEAANWAAREAVQVHGGAGYLKDFPVERYFRDARITEIYEGTSEVQRLVIARQLLRR